MRAVIILSALFFMNNLKAQDLKLHLYKEGERDTLSCYQITKIDSIDGFYIIDAKNDKYRYRIKSEKDDYCECGTCKNKVEVGKVYQLDLISFYTSSDYDLEKGHFYEKNYRIHIDDRYSDFPFEGQCGVFADDNMICRDIRENDNHERVFNKALNLRGLCLVKRKSGSAPKAKVMYDE